MRATQARVLTQNDSRKAFNAFLAALLQSGLGELSATRDVLHGAFSAALDTLRRDERTLKAFANFRSGVDESFIAEFDDALMRAEKYKLVQFPNPSYTRVRIAMTPWTAEEFLDEVGDAEEVLRAAAQRFREYYLKTAW